MRDWTKGIFSAFFGVTTSFEQKKVAKLTRTLENVHEAAAVSHTLKVKAKHIYFGILDRVLHQILYVQHDGVAH